LIEGLGMSAWIYRREGVGEGIGFLGSMDGSGVCMVWGLWMKVIRCVDSEEVVRAFYMHP